MNAITIPEHYNWIFFLVGLAIVAAVGVITVATDFNGDRISAWKAGAGARRLAKHGSEARKDLS